MLQRRFWLLVLIVGLIGGCGAPAADPARVAEQPPTPPATRLIAPTPTATLAPTATPRPTTSTTPTATINSYAVLTALALTPTRTPPPSAPPQRLTIGKIDLDMPILPVDQDTDGNPVVLDHDVGWYERSGSPGSGTSIILWAHVLRFKDQPDFPAPFERVGELVLGDRLSLATTGQVSYEYVVTHQLRVKPEQVEYVQPAPLERVVLISCIGENVIENGEISMTDRLITIAEPIR